MTWTSTSLTSLLRWIRTTTLHPLCRQVLSRLRTAYPESRTKTDLIADRLIGGFQLQNHQENAPKAGSSTTDNFKLSQKVLCTKELQSQSRAWRGMGERVPLTGRNASDGAVFGTGQQDGDTPFVSPLMDGAVEIGT